MKEYWENVQNNMLDSKNVPYQQIPKANSNFSSQTPYFQSSQPQNQSYPVMQPFDGVIEPNKNNSSIQSNDNDWFRDIKDWWIENVPNSDNIKKICIINTVIWIIILYLILRQL